MMPRFRFRWGIASILTIGMVLVIILLMAVTTILDIRHERSIFREELRQRGLRISGTLNDVLFDPLYFSNIDQLQDLAKVMQNQPDMAYVQVFNKDGRLMVDTRQGNYALGQVSDFGLQAFQSRQTIFRENSGLLEVARPISIASVAIGGIQIGFDTEGIEAKIRHIAIERIWQALALIAAGVVLSYLIAQYFVRPLKRLVRATEMVARGEFSSVDRIDRRDEIGDLARAFARMSQTLGERTVERNRAETALRIANSHLETQVEDRTVELRVTNMELRREISERKQLQEQLVQSQKMEAIGQLAGGVAHDFNNLLTPILAYSQLAAKKLPAGDPVRSNLEEIEKAAERAANLIRQLLAFSRRQIIEPCVVDLNALVLELDKMLRRLIGEDIEPITHPAPDLGMIKADPGSIEQVIVNLVVNARAAMPDGGKLTIETANVFLDEAHAREHHDMTAGNYVMLAVSDTGEGMTESVKAHIFEPFFTTKIQGKGTGLGLSTCYGIVKQSGGQISVYSEPGQGTTFKLYFPLVEKTATVVSTKNGSSTLFRGSETILVAEDDRSVRAVATKVLRELGYAVLEADNGPAALEVAQDRIGVDIHLLLTDVVMPYMNGKELADQLAVLHPETRVIFISGYTDDAIVHHGVLEPGINFIHKPLNPVALSSMIRQVLDTKASYSPVAD